MNSTLACKEQMFSDKEVHFIAIQIVDTLTVLSQKKIVHFDLKPANIMYNEDFGTVSDRNNSISHVFCVPWTNFCLSMLVSVTNGRSS
eukprot:COSAG02_NODE_14620_length_1254_cov_0.907359_2_plen_88_part_00